MANQDDTPHDERPTAQALPTTPFSAAEAERRGVSRWRLRELISNAEVRQVHREVYVRADQEDDLCLRAAALALVAPDHVVMVDRTAAWLWQVDALTYGELDVMPPLETFVLRGRCRVRRAQAGGGERDLQPVDVVALDGVRVTTPVRTSLDLACKLGRHEALAVMDCFARTHGVDSRQLMALLPRFRGRRGVVQARELTPLVDGRSESQGESFARLFIHDEGLPMPEPQYVVKVDRWTTYRLDLAYPRLKICVEYDGEQFHTDDEDRKADDRRRKWLRERGWKVIVVTKEDLSGPKREAWLRELRDTIAERAGHSAWDHRK